MWYDVQVQGKVNAITLDSCSRTGLVFQDLVSSCEVVNCSSVEVQSTGIMPTIAIDKTDGIVVCSPPSLLCCRCTVLSQYIGAASNMLPTYLGFIAYLS